MRVIAIETTYTDLQKWLTYEPPPPPKHGPLPKIVPIELKKKKQCLNCNTNVTIRINLNMDGDIKPENVCAQVFRLIEKRHHQNRKRTPISFPTPHYR